MAWQVNFIRCKIHLMSLMKSLRDFFTGTPVENPTLQELAASTVTERTVVPDEAREFTARLPGDEPHPLAAIHANNPFMGKNPQAVFREMQSGKLTPELERQARAAIDVFQKMTGETVNSGASEPFVEGPIEFNPVHNWTRGDRFPNYESEAENHQSLIDQNPRDTSHHQSAVDQRLRELPSDATEEQKLEALWRTT